MSVSIRADRRRENPSRDWRRPTGARGLKAFFRRLQKSRRWLASQRPGRLRDLIRAGNAAARSKDWPEAIRHYQLAIENDPSLHRIRVQLGHAHKESGDLHNAARAYYTVLEHAPLDDDLHLQIGHLEKLRGNTQRAAAAYQKSAQLNPRNVHAVSGYLGLALPAPVEEIVARELPPRVEEIVARELPPRVEEIVARELPARIEQAVDRTLFAKQSQIFDQEIFRRSFRPNDIVAGSITGEYMGASNAHARDFFHPAYEEFCRIYKEPMILHRKFWEWAFIYDRLSKAGVLRSGSRGLGFGVGSEKLPAFFARLGVHITATDAPVGQNWDRSNDESDHKNRLFKPEVIDHESFDKLVSFEYCDMNDIPLHLTDYDFCWSSCSLEHLGSLQHGINFIVNSIERSLKVGGVACHTTELNLTSDDETLETGVIAIYRKKDLQRLCGLLEERGHRVEPLRIEPGTLPPDYFVDVPPYLSNPHLKLLVGSYVTTSVGIVAWRGR